MLYIKGISGAKIQTPLSHTQVYLAYYSNHSKLKCKYMCEELIFTTTVVSHPHIPRRQKLH